MEDKDSRTARSGAVLGTSLLHQSNERQLSETFQRQRKRKLQQDMLRLSARICQLQTLSSRVDRS